MADIKAMREDIDLGEIAAVFFGFPLMRTMIMKMVMRMMMMTMLLMIMRRWWVTNIMVRE